MVDLFFFRDPDAVDEAEAEADAPAPASLNWGDQPSAGQNWGDAAPEEAAPAVAAPAGGAPAAEVDVAQPPAQWDSGLSNVASAWQQE